MASSSTPPRVIAARREGIDAHHPARASAFDQALTEYTQLHYHAAFDALARLADRGHPDAARIALQMSEHGTRLYGGCYGASDATRKRWRALAAPQQEVA